MTGELATRKYRLPSPLVRPPLSVAVHAIVCRPSASVVVSRTQKPTAPLRVGQAGEQLRDVGAVVVVRRAARPRRRRRSTVIVEPSIGMVFGLGVSAQPKLTIAGAGDRLALRRRVDRAERQRRVRVVAGHRARAEQHRQAASIVPGVDREPEGAVALVRQHVRQHHEAPAARVAPRIPREGRLHVRPRAFDEDAAAEEDLRRAAAVRVRSASTSPAAGSRQIVDARMLQSRRAPSR